MLAIDPVLQVYVLIHTYYQSLAQF